VFKFNLKKKNHNSLLLGTLPIIAVLQGRTNVPGIINLPFIVMTSLTMVATLSLARRRLDRWQGVVFVLLYGLVIWGAFHLGVGTLGHG